jgi:ProP effector
VRDVAEHSSHNTPLARGVVVHEIDVRPTVTARLLSLQVVRSITRSAMVRPLRLLKFGSLISRNGQMGFEQLAALKQQLAQQAKSDRKEATTTNSANRPSPSTQAAREPLDPVVHTIGKLQKRFPRAFPRSPASKVALKVGVLDDLLLHGPELKLTEQQVRDAIKVWCKGARYWSCLTEGSPRVDLAGNQVSEVTASEAGRAKHLASRRPNRRTSPSTTTREA